MMDAKTFEILRESYRLLHENDRADISEAKEWIDKAIKLLTDAELDYCPNCHGLGRIDPIENPPYRCDKCAGRGWVSSYFGDGIQKEVERMRAAITESLPLLTAERDGMQLVYNDDGDDLWGNKESYCALAHSVQLLTDALKGGGE